MPSSPSVVVISGASSGIGLACAEAYARQGAALILGARRHERLTALAPRLEELGASAVVALPLDVRERAAVETFAAKALAAFPQIDILINNAGLAAGRDPVASGQDADWLAMIDTNITGLLYMTRRFLTPMRAADHGHIVNIGSIAGFATYGGGAVYAGTKHAVRAISGALRQELLGTRIRVSEIDPGMVETEFSLVRLKDADKAKQVYEGMTPLTGADIADCIVFATSRPPHVNVDHIVIMPTAQASVSQVARRS